MATVCGFINVSYSVVMSLGTRDRMLIIRTIEIPFPTPFSVILSPTHIRNAEPAVRDTTTVITFMAVISGISP